MAGRRRTIPRKWAGKRYSKPPNPIAPGKRGSGQRLIYRSGGGQYHLNIWKSLGKQRRQNLIRKTRKRGAAGGLTKTIRQIGKRRMNGGKPGGKGPTKPQQPITPPTPPTPTFTYPHQRNVPVRLRGFRGENLR